MKVRAQKNMGGNYLTNGFDTNFETSQKLTTVGTIGLVFSDESSGPNGLSPFLC